MNSFFKDVVSHLLKNAFEGHTKFSVADNTAVGDNPIRAISLDAVPANEDTLISLSWDGGEKLFEKTLSEQEASHQFDLISTDLAEVAALTKQGEYDAAKDLMKKLGQKYAENTGNIVDTNLPKLHNTQASEKVADEDADERRFERAVNMLDKKLMRGDIHQEEYDAAYEALKKQMFPKEASEKIAEAYPPCPCGHADASHKWVPIANHGESFQCKECNTGKACELPEEFQPKKASQDDKLWRTAKITMQNLWFSTTDELLDYQQKQKGAAKPGADQDHIPLWDKNKKAPAAKDQLAPASLSYEDVENQKEREHEDMQKHIDEKIKTELESALQEKAASVFGPDQVELVQVLKKNGRNWDEIKKILIKDFNFDKDSVNIFVDEQRQGSDPTGIEVKPEEEKPEDKKPLTPPEELVSPETHEKLLKDHEDKKKDESPVKEPGFSPKEVMDIPEDDEITDHSSLDNEIARADNDDIHKIAAGSDLNPLQEPIQEKPTSSVPQQDKLPMGNAPLDHNAPQKGDRVFVSSDLTDEKAGFEATFISMYKSQGVDFSIVETDEGDLLDIESHRVVKTSEGSGAQDTEPVMEPEIEQPKEQDVPVTPKMDDFHTSSQEDLLAIKAETDDLLKKMADLEKEAAETFRSPVAVDDLYLGQLLGREEVSFMKEAVIQWNFELEMRDWGVKSVYVTVPDQTINLDYEYFKQESAPGAADDGYEKESKQVALKDVQVEGLDRTGFDSLAPQTLEYTRDGRWLLDFGTSSHYSSCKYPRLTRTAEDKPLPPEHICEQCKQPMGYQGFINPVCGKCVRKNHKKVTQGSDFEKGISQNKTSDETLPAKPRTKVPSLKDKDIDPYKFHSNLEWEPGDPCKLCKSPVDENCVCTNPECEFCKDRIGQAYAATKPEGSEPDQVDLIMAYEDGSLDEAGILKLFSQLIKSGDAWSLQGSYRRTAKALIDAGYINQNGTIIKDVVDTEIAPEQKMLESSYSFKMQRTAADPPIDPKTRFKELKITPKYVEKDKAVPATPEMSEVFSKIESLEHNLSALETARKQIQAKMKEQLALIDSQGERVQMEEELQASIEKAGILVGAVDSQVIAWKDKLYTMQKEEISYVPNLTPKEMLAKVYAKFEGAEKYVQDVLNGMLSQSKNIIEKTLIRWPNKKSSLSKESSILDDLNSYNEELLAALKLLSQPL